jgi:hypothetical protein
LFAPALIFNEFVVYVKLVSFVIEELEPANITPVGFKPENVGAPPVDQDMTPPVVETKDKPEEAGSAVGKVYEPAVVAATVKDVIPAVDPDNCRDPLFPVACPLARTPYALTPDVLVAVKLICPPVVVPESVGVCNVGPVANTVCPEPVAVELPVPPLTIGNIPVSPEEIEGKSPGTSKRGKTTPELAAGPAKT